MPNPNAVVATIARFDPPLDRSPLELMRADAGLSVELGGRRVRLDPGDPRSVGFAQILEQLRSARQPVYVEVDPATSAIARMFIPLVTHVTDVRPLDANTITVEVERSHARHVLRRGQADSDELEKRLREAVRTRSPVMLIEDDTHDIIDVRFFRPGPDGPDGPLPPLPPDRPPGKVPPSWIRRWLDRLWIWPWWPWWWFGCISPTRAQQVFDAMNATSCAPLTVPVPCIPFLYPDDGCWARANEMCRLMKAMGLYPRKVWIDASTFLHANTKNNPQCYVNWGWHVAPTLCVRGPYLFVKRTMVIDPALFTTPVTKATWKSVQNDPGATLTDTSASQYWHGGGTDPTYSYTNSDLAYYRMRLQLRAIQTGPPPYAFCP